jgi:uncharacterized membrane protein YoaK (UPF0700 family)
MDEPTHSPPPSSARIRRLLPVALGYVAGYVDGCTFVALFGLFVAQVTGSFVALGFALTAGRASAILTLAAIPAFILGAAVASALSTIWRHRGRRASPILLGLESVLLAAMLATALLAGKMQYPDQPAALLVGLFGLSAMGVQNAFVRLHAKGAPSTNVMTTNTGNLAIDAAHLLAIAWLAKSSSPTSAPADAEQAHGRLAETAAVVLAFLAGTGCGTLACRTFGFACLALPLALLSTFTSLAALRQFDDD